MLADQKRPITVLWPWMCPPGICGSKGQRGVRGQPVNTPRIEHFLPASSRSIFRKTRHTPLHLCTTDASYFVETKHKTLGGKIAPKSMCAAVHKMSFHLLLHVLAWVWESLLRVSSGREERRWNRDEKDAQRRWGEDEEGGSKVRSQQPLLPLERASICCQLLRRWKEAWALMWHAGASHLHRGTGPLWEHACLCIPTAFVWSQGLCCRIHRTQVIPQSKIARM